MSQSVLLDGQISVAFWLPLWLQWKQKRVLTEEFHYDDKCVDFFKLAGKFFQNGG